MPRALTDGCRRRLLIVGVAMLLASPARAAAPAPLETFITRLQDAVGRDDRQAVAAMIAYPASMVVGGFGIPVRNRADFLGVYTLAFSPEMKGALALTAIAKPGQPRPGYPVTITDGGATLAGRFLGLVRAGPTYRIARILAPPTVRAARGQREPIRNLTPSGNALVTTGALAEYQVEWFPLTGLNGRFIDLSLDGFRGRDILARIVDTRTGAPLDARLRAGVRRWTGVVPAAGDYRLEVIRAQGAVADVVIYSLKLLVK